MNPLLLRLEERTKVAGEEVALDLGGKEFLHLLSLPPQLQGSCCHRGSVAGGTEKTQAWLPGTGACRLSPIGHQSTSKNLLGLSAMLSPVGLPPALTCRPASYTSLVPAWPPSLSALLLGTYYTSPPLTTGMGERLTKGTGWLQSGLRCLFELPAPPHYLPTPHLCTNQQSASSCQCREISHGQTVFI